MKIKNYTTAISAGKSITEIEALLAENGASHIMKEYRGDGRVFSLSFKLRELGYKLPANTERVFATLTKGKRNFQRKTWEEQSERVAWRVLRDWLHAQLSLIAIGQAEFDQVMLPYAYNGKQTLYERFKENSQLLLGGSE